MNVTFTFYAGEYSLYCVAFTLFLELDYFMYDYQQDHQYFIIPSLALTMLLVLSASSTLLRKLVLCVEKPLSLLKRVRDNLESIVAQLIIESVIPNFHFTLLSAFGNSDGSAEQFIKFDFFSQTFKNQNNH